MLRSDSDMIKVLDVLYEDVGAKAIFTHWPTECGYFLCELQGDSSSKNGDATGRISLASRRPDVHPSSTTARTKTKSQ